MCVCVIIAPGFLTDFDREREKEPGVCDESTMECVTDYDTERERGLGVCYECTRVCD